MAKKVYKRKKSNNLSLKQKAGYNQHASHFEDTKAKIFGVIWQMKKSSFIPFFYSEH